jgi:hypothetical protein
MLFPLDEMDEPLFYNELYIGVLGGGQHEVATP